MHGSRFRFQVPVPVSLYRCIAVSLFSSSLDYRTLLVYTLQLTFKVGVSSIFEFYWLMEYNGRRIASESKQTVRGGPKPAKVGLHRRLQFPVRNTK